MMTTRHVRPANSCGADMLISDDRNSPLPPSGAAPVWLTSRCGRDVWLALTAISILLVLRRGTGGFTAEAPAVVVWITVAVTGLLSWLAVNRGRMEFAFRPQFMRPLVIALVPVLLTAIAITTFTEPIQIGGVLAELGLMLVFAGWIPDVQPQAFVTAASKTIENREPIRFQVTPTLKIHPEDEESAEQPEPTATAVKSAAIEEERAEAAASWTRRIRDAEQDRLEGGLRVEFLPGQKELVVHLTFQPPFANTPELEAEDVGEGDVEVQIQAVYPFGARLLARRTVELESAFTTEIGYQAVGDDSKTPEGPDE